MLATFPQAKVLAMLGLATVLAVIAIAMLALSAEHRAGSRVVVATASKPPLPGATPRLTATATPGSTAHARQAYRASLGR